MSEGVFKIFVVEDDDWYNRLLVHTLSLNPDYEVRSFYDGKTFLNSLSEHPDLVTLDYRLPDTTGLEILKEVKQFDPSIQVILISEQGDIDTVVELLKYGAYDYIVKTKDIRERLLNTIQNVRRGVGMEREIQELKKEIQKKYHLEHSIIGESEPMQKVFGLMQKAVATNITVTVTGETGTGKELVAKAIHYNSPRKEQKFVPVNVAAIPSELIESELFGHEKGAFTGASYRRIGKFEEAKGGTLFLDEIGEMDQAFQAKLLRAIQEREITRIGSNTPIPVDCRIIVATHRNLSHEVKEGRFRKDLYYRLLGLPIELPPLRNRGNDILLLAKHFLEEFCKENNLESKTISSQAQRKLLSYPFPGNVRELRSVMELAAALSSGNEIMPSDLLLGDDDPLPEIISEELTLREYDRRIIKIYLKKYNDNHQVVAEKLDISVSTIYRMLKEERNKNSR
ncbi:MAG: sigma-54 dependent transcriptional regulator [Bacteroidales bacterium]